MFIIELIIIGVGVRYMVNIAEFIVGSIKGLVVDSQNTKYREPIVAFADVDDPEFMIIKDITHENHMLPTEWMPTGKTVVSFFIPFAAEMVQINKKAEYVAREWAVAYIETNDMIKQICSTMAESLKKYDINAVWQLPAGSYDSEKLMSYWSQRHIAYIAGIGTFGMNNMLITDKGCSGRYGSFIMDYKIEQGKKDRVERCLYKINNSCGICMEACPVQALTPQGFARHRCSSWVEEVDEFYSDLASCDCCGKCLLGPCAVWDK
jgi:epoxyqueuosine reductase QueG